MQIACVDCDLLLEVSELPEGYKNVCPRCNSTLSAHHENANLRIISFTLSGLIFFLLSFQFSFISIYTQGQEKTITLWQSIDALIQAQFPSLALLIFIFIIIAPFLYCTGLMYIAISLNREQLLPFSEYVLRMIELLKQWSMQEVFIISILVSFIKIAALADVSLGLSFLAYAFFIVALSAAILNADNHCLWETLKRKKCIAHKDVDPVHHLYCSHCTEVIPEGAHHCPACGARTHYRKEQSLQKTWALLLTSVILYIPANFLPFMSTFYLGTETTKTILGGIIVLWEQQSYPIAIIIFIASFLIPLLKIVILSWMSFEVQFKKNRFLCQKTKLYRMIDFIGRWSMVDIFVVAILVALIRMGNLMSVYPDWGALAFAGLVISSLLAAQSFDPRLIWDTEK